MFNSAASILAQSNNGGGGAAFFTFIEFVLAVLTIAGFWKVFVKVGYPGWAAIIPFYNVYILVKIAGRPGWWFLLFLIPLVNIAIIIVVSLDVAKRFGKGVGFGIGLALLGFIFYPILGFGDAQYSQPGSEARGFPVTPYPR